MKKRHVIARGLAIVMCCAATAWAEEDSAALFQRANEAVRREAYREAAELFERAHRQAPHPATVFNAAAAWEQAGERPRAADAYETALSMGGLASEQAAYAQERLTVLKKSLGYLRLTAPIGATATVAHAKNVAIPAAVHLAPGSHTVVFNLGSGANVRKPLRLLAGETQSVAAERPPPMAQTQAPQRPEPTPSPAPSPAPDRASGSGQQTWGWVSLGVAGALAAASTVLTVQTFSALDNFEGSGRKDLDARDRALRLRTWSNATAVGAVVLGATGIYLLLSADGGSSANSKPQHRGKRGQGPLVHLSF